ncbi:MAG: Eco57I restriction-modification methylase domain-containing protein [Pyrinomonadaceae bacterium]|nr:Eco57I restriction-modification methylase domain-containing protein [Pyrinomonadaceae bacterium]
MLLNSSYNPDVLSCLANLSSDEVFTPPALANEMLDLLPAELWSNKDARFLDPVCKSGVFLREIAKRLLKGLENEIPDLQKRIDHIFHNQLFGIAITELTGMLSRRSLYCSKKADGEYSISRFDTDQGNIIFERTDHRWKNKKCEFCGASQGEYDRSEDLETHAYQLIHTNEPEKIFNMKFDVIIGNPPYQLNDGGGTGSSARPIYHSFVQQAKKLNPRYLSMILPARWYSGGKGLDEFRMEMLKDRRIRNLTDYADSRECFPGVDIAGGVCFFLWNRDQEGICRVTTVRKSDQDVSERYLNEFDSFIRDNLALKIIKKVVAVEPSSLESVVSSRMPFGLTSNIKFDPSGDLDVISSSGTGRIAHEKVSAGFDLIDNWKVLLSKASNDHGGQPDRAGKRRIFSRIEVIPPRTVCSESYLVVGKYGTREEAENMAAYLKTQFCRFLVSTILLTQNITRGKFAFVPRLSMTVRWTDAKLFRKFGLDGEEIDFVNQLIRPIDSES